jgi:glycosyltransferase involved in cell wall biosynthesis
MTEVARAPATPSEDAGSSRPEVTIVIPTSNRWQLLSTCALPSALGQTDVDHEVVVVDDGSVDETAHELERIDDPRLRILRHATPLGVSRSRNDGIAAARGEWIAFLDDDDLWSPRKLRAQLEAAASSEAGFVYAGAVAVDGRGTSVAALPLPDPATLRDRILNGSSIPSGPSNVVVRADVLGKVGGFDEALSHSADWDMWIRLARATRAAVCDEILVARLEHPARMLFRDRPDVVAEVDAIMRKYRPGAPRNRQGLDEWLALEHFGAGYRARAAVLFLRAAVVHRSPGNLPPALGALFGERGMALASRVLMRTSGASHVDIRGRAAAKPQWLSLYR